MKRQDYHYYKGTLYNQLYYSQTKNEDNNTNYESRTNANGSTTRATDNGTKGTTEGNSHRRVSARVLLRRSLENQ